MCLAIAGISSKICPSPSMTRGAVMGEPPRFDQRSLQCAAQLPRILHGTQLTGSEAGTWAALCGRRLRASHHGSAPGVQPPPQLHLLRVDFWPSTSKSTGYGRSPCPRRTVVQQGLPSAAWSNSCLARKFAPTSLFRQGCDHTRVREADAKTRVAETAGMQNPPRESVA